MRLIWLYGFEKTSARECMDRAFLIADESHLFEIPGTHLPAVLNQFESDPIRLAISTKSIIVQILVSIPAATAGVVFKAMCLRPRILRNTFRAVTVRERMPNTPKMLISKVIQNLR